MSLGSASVIARYEAIFTHVIVVHVMVSGVEPSVRLLAYRSFDSATNDKGGKIASSCLLAMTRKTN